MLLLLKSSPSLILRQSYQSRRTTRVLPIEIQVLEEYRARIEIAHIMSWNNG